MQRDHCYESVHYIPYQPGFEQEIHYRNFVIPIDHPLYGIVSDFYQFDSASLIKEICVIPDGCMDILFRYVSNGVTKALEGYYLEKVMIPTNQMGSAFGVRFVPGGFTNILPIPASELIGKQIPLMDLLKKDSLLEQMDYSQEFSQRVAIISSYLINQVHKSYGSVSIARYCANRIISCQGSIPIGDLSEDTGYTIRYLRNLFHQHIGISPKELCEIIRFQTSFVKYSCLEKVNIDFSLSDLAIQAGYYDQSHMNKSYQKMVGCLPKKFYAEVNQL